MKNKKYRFFYHYYKQKGKMSIHFRGQCMVSKNVVCEVSTQTKWNKTQPQLVVQGFCETVEIIDDTAIIK